MVEVCVCVGGGGGRACRATVLVIYVFTDGVEREGRERGLARLGAYNLWFICSFSPPV